MTQRVNTNLIFRLRCPRCDVGVIVNLFQGQELSDEPLMLIRCENCGAHIYAQLKVWASDPEAQRQWPKEINSAKDILKPFANWQGSGYSPNPDPGRHLFILGEEGDNYVIHVTKE